ncbi:MAG: nitrilase family protein [Chryseobacterium sp.]|nr:MAG: nitrilase family protein [Chryseobacterium sp.]
MFVIAGVSLDSQWKAVDHNLAAAEKLLENATADLLLLPEMFATGFCMDADDIADKGKVLQWMKQLAKNKDSAVAGSVAVRDDGQFYNRFYFVQPDGNTACYDKRHLFSYAGEEKIYTAGKDRVIIKYKGLNILLQVCYDLRFPVFQRNNDDYDLMLNVASWPGKRIDAWQTLLKARAIENQCYAFGLNRSGTDGNDLEYPESSYCFAPDGNDISTKNGDIITANIDKEYLNRFRDKFPFLKDRDRFTLD